jgi:predicted nuclease of predicted toxin-antitoxin system
MRFLIDANLPRAVIDVVQGLGHQVEFARDIGLASATDDRQTCIAISRRASHSGLGLRGYPSISA